MPTTLQTPVSHPKMGVADERGQATLPTRDGVNHFAHLDGLRAVAALWVAIHHAWGAIVWGGFLPSWQGGPVFSFIAAGYLAVTVFIALSGFCLAYPLVSKNRFRVELKSWAIRRALRILPPYYIVLCAVAAVQQIPVLAQRFPDEVPTLPQFLTHVFMIHNLFPDHVLRIAGPFWTIALECQLYVLFPLLILMMKRPWVPMLGALVVAGTWWLAAPPEFLTDSRNPTGFIFMNSAVSMLPMFVLGMVAATMLSRAWRMPAWSAAVAGGLFAAAVFVDQAIPWQVPSRLLALAGTFILLLLPSGRVTSILSWGPLVRLGKVTFTFYLIHQPVIIPLITLATDHVRGPALALVGLAAVALTVGVAFVLEPLIERPFHRIGRRLGSRAS